MWNIVSSPVLDIVTVSNCLTGGTIVIVIIMLFITAIATDMHPLQVHLFPN